MANPKKRKSKSAVRTNRAHLALEKVSLNKCPQCGKAKQPHIACAFCGHYRGRQVVKMGVAVKKTTKAKK
jgi:large subunit ribosomal protein L32